MTTTTKITGITSAHIAFLREDLGFTPVGEAKSFVILDGNREDTLKALIAAREAFTGQWSSGLGNLYGTLKRKLESGKGVKVEGDEPLAEVVEGPWEYPAGGEGAEPVDPNGTADLSAEDEGDAAPDADTRHREPAGTNAPAKAPRKPRAKKTDAKAEPKKTEKKAPAAPRKPRVELPEGYVTIAGLAKAINEKGLYTGSRSVGLTSDALGAYIAQHVKGTSRFPFPLEVFNGRKIVKFSPDAYVAGNGNVKVVKLDEGLAWWAAKNERSAGRKTK